MNNDYVNILTYQFCLDLIVIILFLQQSTILRLTDDDDDDDNDDDDDDNDDDDYDADVSKHEGVLTVYRILFIHVYIYVVHWLVWIIKMDGC